ncbi:MAG: hypothetical protein H0X71_01960 [Rubrobacter sp.]|nr:hypothetical protein [Rubrobacter sp.]
MLGLLIGDCLHNLRAALDNLVYELLVARHGDPPPDKFAVSSEFPIFSDRPMILRQHQRKIGGIDPAAQTIIEGLQPYQRGNDFGSHPLWLLHNLSNIDKHRVPHVALLTIPSAFAYFVNSETDTPVGTSNIEWFVGLIENSAVIARYEPDPDYPDAEMKVNFTPIFGIAFGNEGSAAYGRQVILTLDWMGSHIRNHVIPPLRPYLT